MAETLNLTLYWEIDGKPEVRGGSREVPITLSLTTGTPHYAEHLIPDADSSGVFGEDVLWSTGEGGKDTFQLMIIQSDSANTYIELRNDNASADFITVRLSQNVPLILGSDDIGQATSSAFDAAVLVEGTDYDQIDQVEAHNDNAAGVGDAVVRVWIFD